MVAMWILKSVGMVIGSFIIGIVFYYITSPLQSEQKKKQLEEVLSLIINFVIFIWIGKILLNVSTFISDPLAVLAYPSNAAAVYLATFFFFINIGYKIWKHPFNVEEWLGAFVPVFLASTFSYEFIQLIESGSKQGLNQLILLMILLICYLLFQRKLSIQRMALILITGWALGQFILSITFPMVTLFGYTMRPWFNFALTIIFTGFSYYKLRKQVL